MSEKRTHQRLQLTYPFHYHNPESGASSHTVFENICEEGMKICTDDILENNNRIKFSISLLGKLINGEGKIVWYKSSLNGGSHSAGVKFTTIEPAAKINLSKFILELTRA